MDISQCCERRKEVHMKKSIIIVILIFALALMPYRSYAVDAGPIFTTPLVGTSIGAMIGYLTTFFAKNPADHYNSNVSIGAGIGFAAGLALGISGSLKASASFYQRDTSKEKLYGLNINIPLK
jgi:NhaP-type Na+/H+ or K+/H+ antiporter